MRASHPVIAIIDDYEAFVPQLSAYAWLRQQLPTAQIRVMASQPLNEQDLAGMYDVEYLVLIRERTRVTAELLERLPSLKALVQTGTAGARETSHIDHDACERRGISIVEGRASDGHSAAELTWALILNARRQVNRYVNSMAAGHWQQGGSTGEIAVSLRGQTLGILGYGRIGQLLGTYAEAFGMKALIWGREQSRQAARDKGVDIAASRQALFEQSDVLALQMRMNPESRHSVTQADLSLMKPTSLLVNTGRPGLIAPGALLAALKAGRPGAAAIDVHDDEPLLETRELSALPNCLATPHIGYVERNSYEVLFEAAFRELVALVLKNRPPPPAT